jgi:hypothetical protein
MQMKRRFSAMVQKATLQGDLRMSALTPKADIGGTRHHVRFGPGADLKTSICVDGIRMLQP